jgi:hypothetical protein
MVAPKKIYANLTPTNMLTEEQKVWVLQKRNLFVPFLFLLLCSSNYLLKKKRKKWCLIMIKENMISVIMIRKSFDFSFKGSLYADFFSVLVIFGATGFTGALTAEYLAEIKDEVCLLYLEINASNFIHILHYRNFPGLSLAVTLVNLNR